MGQARKYIITLTETRPSGLTTVVLPLITYNLTNEFSGTRDDGSGGSFEYYNITLEDLALLTEQQYNKRVEDFLIYIQVDTQTRRSELLTEASFEDASC